MGSQMSVVKHCYQKDFDRCIVGSLTISLIHILFMDALNVIICFLIMCLFIHHCTDIIHLIQQTDTTASDRMHMVVLDIESLGQASDRSSGSPKMTVSSSLVVVNVMIFESHPFSDGMHKYTN